MTEVMADMSLDVCADTKIGNEIVRGVSGGQRKRVSIAMELITRPNVLFVDEPTRFIHVCSFTLLYIMYYTFPCL